MAHTMYQIGMNKMLRNIVVALFLLLVPVYVCMASGQSGGGGGGGGSSFVDSNNNGVNDPEEGHGSGGSSGDGGTTTPTENPALAADATAGESANTANASDNSGVPAAGDAGDGATTVTGTSDPPANNATTLTNTNANTNKGTESADGSPTGGDPVLLTTGRYLFNETDIHFPDIDKDFAVGRYYRSEGKVEGSLGQGWITSLDSRIILGANPYYRQLANDYKTNYVDVLSRNLDEYIEGFKERWRTGSDWRNTESIYTSRIEELRDIEASAEANVEDMTDLKGRTEGFLVYVTTATRNRIEAALEEAEEILNSVQTKKAAYEAALPVIQTEMGNITSLEGQLASARVTLAVYTSLADKSDSIMSANGKVIYPATPEYYYATGFDTMTWVDPTGTARLFKETGDGIWKPEAKDDLSTTISENSAGGYIVNIKGGNKYYYNDSGLLFKFEKLDSSTITITWKSNGQIEKINDSHSNEWKVSYSGNYISKIEGPLSRSVAYSYSG
ncbi:MAG: DUF6531 domain-containing protein, partial [Spirochaetaceae bacterium]|nr:DUF6531 domain-containing protein [Spirochaetaceae bacterium]